MNKEEQHMNRSLNTCDLLVALFISLSLKKNKGAHSLPFVFLQLKVKETRKRL